MFNHRQMRVAAGLAAAVIFLVPVTFARENGVLAPRTDDSELRRQLKSAGAKVEVDDKQRIVAVHFVNDNMAETRATDADLALIGGLREIRRLTVVNARITDRGLEHLSGLKNLVDLDLSINRISDKGIVHLRKLHRLRRVNVWHTQVTEAGANKLKEALPRVEVEVLERAEPIADPFAPQSP